MPVNPCPVGGEYKGPSPVKDYERPAIWKWARENADFTSQATAGKAINDHFFGGRAPDAWIQDIIAGRKTPFQRGVQATWRANYDRQQVVAQAKRFNELAGRTVGQKIATGVWNSARILETIGHAIVFPESHAGDLIYRPSSWDVFFKGYAKTVAMAYNKDYYIAQMGRLERDRMFPLAVQGGLDVGRQSHAVGLLGEQSAIVRKLGELPGLRNIVGAAGRAWDAMGANIRFELWKKAMLKNTNAAGMTPAELLEYSKEFATWANDATGAGKGRIANLGPSLFGPKLTQAKINRVSEIAKTPYDFANWNNLTPAQKSVAWTRMSGATQYLITRLGFLGANAGLLAWLGSNQKLNLTHPFENGYLQFKGLGLEFATSGISGELTALARIAAFAYGAYTGQKRRGQETGPRGVMDIGAQYAEGKLNPMIERIAEVASGQTFEGRPLPWNPDAGTPQKPRESPGEYAAQVGPIPLQGPIKYIYDQIKGTGASASDSLAITRGLIIFGVGATGVHVQPEPPEKVSDGSRLTRRTPGVLDLQRAMRKQQAKALLNTP